MPHAFERAGNGRGQLRLFRPRGRSGGLIQPLPRRAHVAREQAPEARTPRPCSPSPSRSAPPPPSCEPVPFCFACCLPLTLHAPRALLPDSDHSLAWISSRLLRQVTGPEIDSLCSRQRGCRAPLSQLRVQREHCPRIDLRGLPLRTRDRGLIAEIMAY